MWQQMAIWFAMRVLKNHILPKVALELERTKIQTTIKTIEDLRARGKLK